MKLSTFISETITEIGLGLKKAQENTADKLAVAPGSLNDKRIEEPTYIEFDIALTVSDEKSNETASGKSAGGGVSIMNIGAKGSVESNEIDGLKSGKTSLNRVNFKIPVYLNATMK